MIPGMFFQRVDCCDVIRGYPSDGPGPVVSLTPFTRFVVAEDANLNVKQERLRQVLKFVYARFFLAEINQPSWTFDNPKQQKSMFRACTKKLIIIDRIPKNLIL